MSLEHDTEISMSVVKMCIDKYRDIRISSSRTFTAIRFQRYMLIGHIGLEKNYARCDIEVSYCGVSDLYTISIYDDSRLLWKTSDRYSIEVIDILYSIYVNSDINNIEKGGVNS